jgi:hypothetical protein
VGGKAVCGGVEGVLADLPQLLTDEMNRNQAQGAAKEGFT